MHAPDPRHRQRPAQRVRQISIRPIAPPRSDDAAATRRRQRFPNLLLRTHRGASVRLYDDLLLNKTVLVQFINTHCTQQCSRTISTLARVQALLGTRLGLEIFMYSVTVDPERDTPAVMSAHARSVGAAPGWVFLTGTSDAIASVRRTFGDDPRLTPSRSHLLNLIAYGAEPLERWGGVPPWTEPATIVRYVTSILPAGIGLRNEPTANHRRE